jgi:hypothetical protein
MFVILVFYTVANLLMFSIKKNYINVKDTHSGNKYKKNYRTFFKSAK